MKAVEVLEVVLNNTQLLDSSIGIATNKKKQIMVTVLRSYLTLLHLMFGYKIGDGQSQHILSVSEYLGISLPYPTLPDAIYPYTHISGGEGQLQVDVYIRERGFRRLPPPRSVAGIAFQDNPIPLIALYVAQWNMA